MTHGTSPNRDKTDVGKGLPGVTPVLIVVKANKGQSEDPELYRLGVKNPSVSMSSRCYPESSLLTSVVRAEEWAASINSDTDQRRLNLLFSWRDLKGNCWQLFLCQLPLQLHSGHCTSYLTLCIWTCFSNIPILPLDSVTSVKCRKNKEE